MSDLTVIFGSMAWGKKSKGLRIRLNMVVLLDLSLSTVEYVTLHLLRLSFLIYNKRMMMILITTTIC